MLHSTGLRVIHHALHAHTNTHHTALYPFLLMHQFLRTTKAASHCITAPNIRCKHLLFFQFVFHLSIRKLKPNFLSERTVIVREIQLSSSLNNSFYGQWSSQQLFLMQLIIWKIRITQTSFHLFCCQAASNFPPIVSSEKQHYGG